MQRMRGLRAQDVTGFQKSTSRNVKVNANNARSKNSSLPTIRFQVTASQNIMSHVTQKSAGSLTWINSTTIREHSAQTCLAIIPQNLHV